MKLWPKGRLKKMLLVTTLIVLASIGVVAAWVFYKINSDVVSEVKVLNPEGDKGTALVVYHPGLSDFQYKVTYAFAEGLVSSGWRVEITTASSQAPTDLSSHDLLVLGSPTYGPKPAPTIQRYLSRIGDLEHKCTVIICTAGGSPATEAMENLVQAANGVVVKSLDFLTRDNEAVRKAAQAGKELTLP